MWRLSTSTLTPVQNGRIRFNFLQDIIRKSDNKIVASAINTGTCIDIETGRPIFSEKLKDALGILAT